MKKIEVVVSKLYLERIIEILEEYDVFNYTVLAVVDGRIPGEDRMHDCGLVPAQDKSYLFAITEDSIAQKVVSKIKNEDSELHCLVFTSLIEH